MSNKPELILVADKQKLLELAKGSKLKFDRQLLIQISLAAASLLSKLNPITSVASSIAVAAVTAYGFKKTAPEKDKTEFLQEKILKKIQDELSLSTEIVCIDPANAKSLKLGIGDKPTNGSFYIKHPLLEDFYIRPSEYELTLAREKEAAFRTLASTLGAKSITLLDAKFLDSNGSVKVNTKVMQAVSTNIGISASFDKSGVVSREVCSEFGPPRKEPFIPEELKMWTEFDPDLRTMARDRLDGHLIKHRISLKFKDNFSGGGKIAAEIADKGLDIGGSITKNVSSVWFFEVEYYPISEVV
ncbi:hypothetical protein J599_2547 [Acinetobacter baumannii 1598530]|nr:hypothetical protein J599_2547 [Acinetobacter baumannii 1598530]